MGTGGSGRRKLHPFEHSDKTITEKREGREGEKSPKKRRALGGNTDGGVPLSQLMGADLFGGGEKKTSEKRRHRPTEAVRCTQEARKGRPILRAGSFQSRIGKKKLERHSQNPAFYRGRNTEGTFRAKRNDTPGKGIFLWSGPATCRL